MTERLGNLSKILSSAGEERSFKFFLFLFINFYSKKHLVFYLFFLAVGMLNQISCPPNSILFPYDLPHSE